MTYQAVVGGDKYTQVATLSGWRGAKAWADRLDEDEFGKVLHLFHHGWTQDLAEAEEQFIDAAVAEPVDASTSGIVKEVVKALQGRGAADESIFITDGMGPELDDDAEWFVGEELAGEKHLPGQHVQQSHGGGGKGGARRAGSGYEVGNGKDRISESGFKEFVKEAGMGANVRIQTADGKSFIGRTKSAAADGSMVFVRGKEEGAKGRGEVEAFKAGREEVVAMSSVDKGVKGKPRKITPESGPPEKTTPKSKPKPAPSKVERDTKVREGLTTSAGNVKKMEAVADSLSKEQKQAVNGYTLSDYSVINSDLHHDKPVRKDFAAQDKLLEKATNQQLSKPVNAYRIIGLHDDDHRAAFWAGMESGSNLKLPGYTSTTLDAAQGFTTQKGGRAATLEIKAKRGLYVDSVSANKGEKELLLPKGSDFKVVGIKATKFRNSKGELVDVDVVQLEQL